MKTVAHIVNEKVVRQQVPDDWIQCSVLGEFRPPEEFRQEGEINQSRTNCTRAYLMPLTEWEHHKDVAKKLNKQLDAEWQKIRDEQLEKNAGASIDELIAMLQDLKNTNPDARIVIEVEDQWHYPFIDAVRGYKNIFTL